jgi:hypothetical protein
MAPQVPMVLQAQENQWLPWLRSPRVVPERPAGRRRLAAPSGHALRSPSMATPAFPSGTRLSDEA